MRSSSELPNAGCALPGVSTLGTEESTQGILAMGEELLMRWRLHACADCDGRSAIAHLVGLMPWLVAGRRKMLVPRILTSE